MLVEHLHNLIVLLLDLFDGSWSLHWLGLEVDDFIDDRSVITQDGRVVAVGVHDRGSDLTDVPIFLRIPGELPVGENEVPSNVTLVDDTHSVNKAQLAHIKVGVFNEAR